MHPIVDVVAVVEMIVFLMLVSMMITMVLLHCGLVMRGSDRGFAICLNLIVARKRRFGCVERDVHFKNGH